MKKSLVFFVLSFLVCFAQAANVAPLGLEVGVADIQTVKTKLAKQTKLIDAGTNKWTQGPMLTSDGRGLDIDGLQSILFIFDQQKKLQAVVMTMSKSRFNEVREYMNTKYKPVKEMVPFVGDAYVRYQSDNSIAEIDAPHLSFSMEVRYLTNEFLAKFNEQKEMEEADRKKNQREKF